MPPILHNAIQQRFACREFKSAQPVSEDGLATLLQAGRLAPSAFGLEPWRFVSVTDAARRTDSHMPVSISPLLQRLPHAS